jgi:hypothetical protein
VTRPNNPITHVARAGATNLWASRWLAPLVPVALGGVILVATATTGHIVRGLVWFAALATIGALAAIARRFEAGRRGRGRVEDDREAIINAGALSIVGTVLVIAITGCAAFTLARGESASPYTALLAVGGISYAIAWVALRKRVDRRLDR